MSTQSGGGSRTEVAQCSLDNAEISATTSTPAGGHFFIEIHLTNGSSRTCRTAGYPGVAVLSDNRRVFQAVRTPRGYGGGLPSDQNAAPQLTLRSGQQATALLEGASTRQPRGEVCPSYPMLLVTPPDTRKSITISATTLDCKAPQIHPLRYGSVG